MSLERNASNAGARPFLKWAGGKRALIPELLRSMPDSYNTYYEPFVGGGAFFFAIASQLSKAWLSDMNCELMTTYRVIATRCDELVQILSKHQKEHSKSYYSAIRKRHNMDCPVEMAARMIYLNKTCFNGLYRVNSAGRFNVPIGSYTNPKILDEENLRAVCDALKKVELTWQGFEKIEPRSDDLVYCDPPYDETYNSYTQLRFNGAEQKLLAQIATRWHERGVKVMLSNSDTPMIREYYKDRHWNIRAVEAPRNINCKSDGRGKVPEVLITNYSYDIG